MPSYKSLKTAKMIVESACNDLKLPDDEIIQDCMRAADKIKEVCERRSEKIIAGAAILVTIR